MEQFSLPGRRTLTLRVGDLTQERVGAIVNAANTTLLGGGGVDGAIHRRAGRQLLRACRDLPESSPGVRCPTGHARITPGFSLNAEHVIHTVGPVFASSSHSAPLLRAAWTASLDLAAAHHIHSIAFPAISCGVFGYPHYEAAEVSLLAVRDHSGDIPDIRIVLFDPQMLNLWHSAATRILRKPGDDLVQLLETDEVRGPILLGALKNHGLNPTMLGQGLAAMVGAARFIVPVRILVPAHELEEAQATVAVLQAQAEQTARPDDPAYCPECNAPWEPGFDACWQCQAER